MGRFEENVKGDMKSLEERLRGNISSVEERLKSQVKSQIDEVKSQVGEVRDGFNNSTAIQLNCLRKWTDDPIQPISAPVQIGIFAELFW